MKTRMILLTVVFALLAGLVVIPAAGQDTVKLVVWADDTRAPILNELADDVLAAGIELEVVERPFGEIRDNFKTAAPAGEGADIIIGAHDWLGELVVNGLVAPFDLSEEKADEFVGAAVNAFNYEGTLYGIPYAMENVAFVYNTELVEEAPTTWDEVYALSEEIVSSGAAEYGYIIQQNDPYHFFGLQSAFGGYVFGFSEETGYDATDVGIDSEGSIAALTWLGDYVAEGYMPSGLDYDTMHATFEAGDAAMMITGPWAIERIAGSGVPFAVAPIPGQGDVETGRPFLGVQGFMVNAFSENQTLASIFLTDFVATEDVMAQLAEVGGRPSAYVSVAEAIEDPVLAAFSAAGADGLAMPSIPEMGAVWSSWGNSIELVVQGSADAETAFVDAAAAIREAIEGEE